MSREQKRIFLLYCLCKRLLKKSRVWHVIIGTRFLKWDKRCCDWQRGIRVRSRYWEKIFQGINNGDDSICHRNMFFCKFICIKYGFRDNIGKTKKGKDS